MLLDNIILFLEKVKNGTGWSAWKNLWQLRRGSKSSTTIHHKELRMFLLSKPNDLFESFKASVYAEGDLNHKTKSLIALACAVMADCAHCIRSYYIKCRESGASTNEIYEALAITMAVNAGSKKAKYSDLIAELEKDNNDGKN